MSHPVAGRASMAAANKGECLPGLAGCAWVFLWALLQGGIDACGACVDSVCVCLNRSMKYIRNYTSVCARSWGSPKP